MNHHLFCIILLLNKVDHSSTFMHLNVFENLIWLKVIVKQHINSILLSGQMTMNKEQHTAKVHRLVLPE